MPRLRCSHEAWLALLAACRSSCTAAKKTGRIQHRSCRSNHKRRRWVYCDHLIEMTTLRGVQLRVAEQQQSTLGRSGLLSLSDSPQLSLAASAAIQRCNTKEGMWSYEAQSVDMSSLQQASPPREMCGALQAGGALCTSVSSTVVASWQLVRHHLTAVMLSRFSRRGLMKPSDSIITLRVDALCNCSGEALNVDRCNL